MRARAELADSPRRLAPHQPHLSHRVTGRTQPSLGNLLAGAVVSLPPGTMATARCTTVTRGHRFCDRKWRLPRLHTPGQTGRRSREAPTERPHDVIPAHSFGPSEDTLGFPVIRDDEPYESWSPDRTVKLFLC